MKERKMPGIRIVAIVLAVWGCLPLFFALIRSFGGDPKYWRLAIGTAVYFGLAGIALLIDLLTLRFRPHHWVRDEPEGGPVSVYIWFLFITLGPMMIAGLIISHFTEEILLDTEMWAVIVGLMLCAFVIFLMISRALVNRRQRRPPDDRNRRQ